MTVCPRCKGNPEEDLRTPEDIRDLRRCGVPPMTSASHHLCCGMKRGQKVMSRNPMRRRKIGGKRGRNSGIVKSQSKKKGG